MADIRDYIQKTYDIDIKKENLLKLYKIDSPDISAEDLEMKIADRRKKWNQGVNGANEKFAERDRKYLATADTYEVILRDAKIRKELFAYYNKKSGGNAGTAVSNLVKQYFALVSRTTKVGKAELDFFLKYFPEERANKKNILDYLKREHRIIIANIGGNSKDDDDNEDQISVDEKEKKTSNLIQNHFTERTLVRLRKCELDFEEAKRSEIVCKKLLLEGTSFYDYLELEKCANLEQFDEFIAKKRAEIYNIRNEFGTDFVPLVDAFNGLASIVGNNDVRDNFGEFKLLVMYSALTPYMYGIKELKKETLEKLYEIANDEYDFRSLTNFLVSYFNVVYDNFGIYEDSIRSIMKKAEKQMGKEKAINAISDLFRKPKRVRIPVKYRSVYILSYWPIHVLDFIFQIIKFVIEKLRWFGVALGCFLTLIFVLQGEQLYGETNVFTHGLPWKEYLHALNGLNMDANGILTVLSSLEAILKIFFMYGAVGLTIGYFLWSLSVSMRKQIDLKGIARSFTVIIDSAKKRVIEQGEDDLEGLPKKKMPLIISNIVFVVMVIVVQILLILL